MSACGRSLENCKNNARLGCAGVPKAAVRGGNGRFPDAVYLLGSAAAESVAPEPLNETSGFRMPASYRIRTTERGSR